jgi:hypothetical protein
MTNPNWWRLRTVSRNDCDPADYVRRPFNEWREIPSTALDRPEMRDVVGLTSATERLRLRRARLILTDVLARNSSGGRA